MDASPWGGGGVLFVQDVAVRCFACTWRAEDFEGRNVVIGQPAAQTFFEICAEILAIELWRTGCAPTTVLGDNTAALQEVLDMKGANLHEDLAQVLAVLRCSRTLTLAVGHLPSESNVAADALSRQAEPGSRHPWPFPPEMGVAVDTPLRPATLWGWLR